MLIENDRGRDLNTRFPDRDQEQEQAQLGRKPAPHGDPFRPLLKREPSSPEPGRTWRSPIVQSSNVTIALSYGDRPFETALEDIMQHLAELDDAPKGCTVLFGLGLWAGNFETSVQIQARTDARCSVFILTLLQRWDQRCAYVSVDSVPYCCARNGWKKLP